MRWFVFLWPMFFALSLARADDVFFGLNDPTQDQWRRWFVEMKSQREKILREVDFKPEVYDDPAASWADFDYRQFKIFVFDRSFYDVDKASYRTPQLIDEIIARFGKIDSVLLWQGYPQIGFDSRNQFDFYRQLPGGLERLRKDVVDVLHAHGIRVFLDYNPWDAPKAPEAYQELANVVGALGADGVMLDTLHEVSPKLRKAIERVKKGVVLSPERKIPDSDLRFAHQSWAQWYDIGSSDRPSIYRSKWLVPRHLQFTTRRWDTDRRRDIVYSFFNGSALLIWDNIYGTWNPYSSADRKLIAETGAVLEGYREFFTRGQWWPLIPTGVDGLDANRWDHVTGGKRRSIYVFRNRTDRALAFKIPGSGDRDDGLNWFSIWENGGTMQPGWISIVPSGTQALVLDSPEHAQSVLKKFMLASTRAEAPVPVAEGEPAYDERTPLPRRLGSSVMGALVAEEALEQRGMVKIPGGTFTMTVQHKKREEGCYPFGASRDAQWGWFYEDVITHKVPASEEPFGMKITTVTNAEYLRFIWESGYQPRDVANFLKQIPRDAQGRLPLLVAEDLANLPVTYVSLEDARAYARWHGEFLPSESQWQWAAEGAGLGYKWPWGSSDPNDGSRGLVNMTGKIAPASSHTRGASKQGLLNMTGNVWELTESEWTDGHTRYVMLRGGVYLPPSPSEWVIPRGPRPNTFHAKYLMMSDGLDRSEAIGFRTVALIKK